MTFSKICIYGAGAIGGWIGARLAQRPGVMLSVVARGETLRQLQSHGLQLNSGDNILSAKVQASQLPTSLGIQDLVIIAVKAPSMLDVAKQIQPLIGPNTIVMTAMNGVPWWFLQGFGGVHANTPLKVSIHTDKLLLLYLRHTSSVASCMRVLLCARRAKCNTILEMV